MTKRIISIILAVSFMLAIAPQGFAAEQETAEISNRYIKVVVNKANGGYVISTLEGDILKKSDDNALLTHRGENFDTSFTSFKVDSDEYVFGNRYGLLSGGDTVTAVSPSGDFITSTWNAGGISVEQKISLVNNDASEQLGTAMISYTVKNTSESEKTIKSRVLIDTQLGDKDFGYYEVPKQNLGQGYEYFEFERTWDSSLDPGIKMPSDYFVRDNPYSSDIVGFGVNSVFTEQKPYKMTFAHWANIAATVFDYTPDTSLNFTNSLNEKKTADSASALYYDLGGIAPGAEKTFSTYYGVTANLKNKNNRIIVNTTAPSKLEFKDAARTAYKGSEGEDNVVRINTTLTNPNYTGKSYKKLAVVVYALGFDTQRRTDAGTWIEYDNADPIYSDIIDFMSGENRVTYFDFKFEPQNRAQLGTFVTKVFDMDESVNELGSYAEEYCLAETENHIIIPGTNKSLPAITLADLSPEIIYNRDVRYITVSGRGMSFFRSDLLNKIELRGENGKNYEIPIENLIFEQGNDPTDVSMMLEEYMEPGRYQLHFVWKSDVSDAALDGVPADFTSDGMVIGISDDSKYNNAAYGIVTIQRADNNKYSVVPYKNEAAFEKAAVSEEKLLLSFRGDILQDRSNKSFYRLSGKDKDVNINHILNYHGGDLTIEEKADGTCEVLMDGKITTVGANTTVRNGSAAFRLKGGCEYIIPEYDERGEVQKNGTLAGGQDFIELKWDNAFDTLTTIGGFLIDMKYGVLGKIINDGDSKKSDIISFGGSLDLSFMTPGGAAAVRSNTAAGAKWTTKGTELNYGDELDDGYSFGLTFDEDSGEFRSQVAERDIEPTNKDADRVEAGASIHDVLFGGKTPGYIGINMSANVTLPQLVKFLPQKIEGTLDINTIGGYMVGVDAEVETAAVAMAFSLVVKSSPSGAPVPDKMYFSIGGFEPGINVDGLGVLWVTGGGGGFENLYDTIYGKDGVPPLTLLLHVEFDVTKILTGNADLELSLRSLKISFDDLSLKKIKDAKFVDGGEVAVGWYPNFNLNLSAGVNFMQIMHGRFTITAAAGNDTADFVQFALYVAINLPKYIPIVGGMELASAELGGGSEKVWGAVEVLSLIKVGFTYYWGGKIEFTHGSSSGTETFAALSADDDEGIRRTKMLYNEMLKPMQIGEDPKTGEPQFASIGGNLSYCAGSTAVADFEERAAGGGITLMDAGTPETEIITNAERTKHIVTFGEQCDYMLSVSRSDGGDVSDIRNCMKVTKDGAAYGLNYYTAPATGASDAEKKAALRDANINICGNAAYIAIPKSESTGKFMVEFSDNNAYDISAVKVNPISEITSCNAQLNGNELTVSWSGNNLSDSAKIIISATDSTDSNSVVLNENEISAKSGSATVLIPEKLASGEYNINITLSDENTCFDKYSAGTVSIVNTKAPLAATDVKISNCGDDRLKITVDSPEQDFDGYLVEVYEDGVLADTGLYFGRDEEITVGGRYDVPITDEYGNPTGQSMTVGYTPGRKYSAKVRLCNIEDPDKNASGDEIYHCSPYKMTSEETLKESSRPEITLDYKDGRVVIKSNVPVSGELYIDSDINNRYEFNDKSSDMSQETELADGSHTLEFYARDEDGDHALVQQIVNVDTTPPTVLVSSPVSGALFDGDSLEIAASADMDAEYSFKINGNSVLPKESNLFEGGMLKCTLPLGNEKNSAKINLEINACDASGNKTVKNILLTNKKLSEINSIFISNTEDEPADGKIILAEGESAELKVFGTTPDGSRTDITGMTGVTVKAAGGSSAELDGTKVTGKFGGQTLISAELDLGGNDSLYDGVVIETADKPLNFSALKQIIEEAKLTENIGYTDVSWAALQNAIAGGEQIINTDGVSQSDIDNASTAISDAIAALIKKGSGGSSSLGGGTAYYVVSFDTNGGSTAENQRVQSGHKLTLPADPTKAGYTFDGWYSDKELKTEYDFSKGVTSSFTLYAKWKDNAYISRFTDVNENDWFCEDVLYACRSGLFSGTSETGFEPNASLSRAMLVTVLWRAEGKPQINYAMLFEDVNEDSYYAEAVRWAAGEKIVYGYSDTEFAPDDRITREQLAAVMYRYAAYKGYDVSAKADLSAYTDAKDISEYALAAIGYAVGTGFIKGKSGTTVNPLDNVTRAETAAILRRFIEGNK